MRSLFTSERLRVGLATLMAGALIIGSAATVAAKAPPKPSPKPTPAPSPTITLEIAPTGTLEPSGEYGNVDVTVTCPTGWGWSYGRLYVLRGDLGGSATFSATCTGTPQVARARIVNGNRFQLGDWTATAYVGIVSNGQEATTSTAITTQVHSRVAFTAIGPHRQ